MWLRRLGPLSRTWIPVLTWHFRLPTHPPAPSLHPQGLISLLLRTAATGVLATLLDAAIEFRRRQLLAAAAADDSGVAGADDGTPSRFPGLGMLSRAGVSAWKARLLVAIDELERRAEACGIGASPAAGDSCPSRCRLRWASPAFSGLPSSSPGWSML